MFMTRYSEQWTALDTIAKRIRALGHRPAPIEFVRLASIKVGRARGRHMIRHWSRPGLAHRAQAVQGG
jgi:DNA-binding ferritin-like protein